MQFFDNIYLHLDFTPKPSLMFHLYITLSYIFPSIYLFFRIMSLFISKRYRLLYAIVYLLTAAVYPIAQGFLKENANLFQQVLSAIPGYSLPFFLYLFMFVVLFDLFLLINLLVKIISPEKRKSFLFPAIYSFCDDCFVGCRGRWRCN